MCDHSVRNNGTVNNEACNGISGAVSWAALFEDSGDAVFVVDGDGRIVQINEYGAALLGSPAAVVTGRSYADFYAADFTQERLGFIRTVVETGQTLVVEGMVNGVWCRATMRRVVPGPGAAPLVLVVLATGERIGTGPTVRAKVDDFGPLSVLTGRELEILRLIGNGLSTAEIASELQRSVKTIEWHRVSLGTKLKASNRVGLARIAIRAGLSALNGKSPSPTQAAA